MHFNWAWESLLGVEFLTKALWEHFVNANISQKEIEISEQLPLVLEFSIFPSESIKTNNFSNTGNIQIFNLSFKVTLGVFHDEAHSGIIVF